MTAKFLSIPSLLRLAAIAMAITFAVPAHAEKRYVGGDVSLLPQYEEAGAQYKTHEGEPISDVLAYCRAEGMNAMRVRVFVNPADYAGSDKDPNACQTIESVLPLCRRIKDAGLDLVLDFMYSDTWADPGKQWTPKQWQGLDDEQLYRKIYDYTKESLETLKQSGVVPDFIQTGNEISFGMLWGSEKTPEKDLKKALMGSNANWDRFGSLLRNAIKACNEVCPEAKIIIHTERVGSVDVQKNFYQQMKRLNVEYDIIGISYYPYFHGSMSVLEKAITELETDFPEKRVMVVETGYPYKWAVPGTTEKVDYPYTDAGQDQFAKDLVAMLEQHDIVDGLFWWWMEYNAFGTKLEGWYNAPLFDSLTGCAGSALKTLCSFAKDSSGANAMGRDVIKGNVRWYDINGVPVADPAGEKGLLISTEGKKILNR